MQKIRQVVTNEFYKQQYIAVGEHIFTKEKALLYFASQKNSILKQEKIKLVSPQNVLPVIYTPLPKLEQLQHRILKKREEIYEKLNLKKTNSSFEKQEQAKKLFEYLVKQINYDMTTREEVLNVNSYDKVNMYIKAMNTKIKTLEQHYNRFLSAQNETEKQHYKTLYNEVEKSLQKTHHKLENEEKKVQNKVTIESIYYTLIKQRGICGEFSYAYSYLLEGLNIKNYVVDLKFNENGHSMYHAINILSLSENEKEQFYVADVTLGVNAKDQFLKAFMMNKNDFNKHYPSFDILHLGKLNRYQKNERLVTNFYKGSDIANKITNYFSSAPECQKE